MNFIYKINILKKQINNKCLKKILWKQKNLKKFRKNKLNIKKKIILKKFKVLKKGSIQKV